MVHIHAADGLEPAWKALRAYDAFLHVVLVSRQPDLEAYHRQAPPVRHVSGQAAFNPHSLRLLVPFRPLCLLVRGGLHPLHGEPAARGTRFSLGVQHRLFPRVPFRTLPVRHDRRVSPRGIMCAACLYVIRPVDFRDPLHLYFLFEYTAPVGSFSET